MEKMTSVKKESFRYLREHYNVSLADIYKSTKIQIENLMKFENGEDFPSYSQLEKLADYYNKPLFYFFCKDAPKEIDVQIQFRNNREIYEEEEFSKQTIELIEKASIYRLNLKELYEDENKANFFELIGECKYDDLYDFLRRVLDLNLEKQRNFPKAENLLEYLREKFYDLGVYIFKDSFRNDSISGLCIYNEDFPIILLNNKTSFNRQVFTLFHEIYHLYLREADIDYTYGVEERKCNEFASNFLIPDYDLKKQLDYIDDIEDFYSLSKLAKKYNVSTDAIMYRLVKMNLLEKSFYEKKKVGYFRDASSGTGGNYYFTKMSYLGTRYINKVFSSYYSGKLTKSQVGLYTGIKSVNVSKLATKMMGGAY